MSDTGTTELGRMHICHVAQPVRIPLARAASGDAPGLFTWLLAGLEGTLQPGLCIWGVPLARLTPSFEGFYLIKDLACTLANQGLKNLSLR